MQVAIRLIIFLVLNFAALGIGGLFTNKGVNSDWYHALNKAPWTPPGWVFGAAWTTIMICLSIYMANLWPVVGNKKLLLTLYVSQWILNVVWNPVFFHYRNTSLGLVVISSLTLLMVFQAYFYSSQMQLKSLLLAPYIIWLFIATSLNAYIVLKN
ncbi:tryptophan-rich sensory protein [bacterium]|nr:tryptophan-rich sensory protein [bacterium]